MSDEREYEGSPEEYEDWQRQKEEHEREERLHAEAPAMLEVLRTLAHRYFDLPETIEKAREIIQRIEGS